MSFITDYNTVSTSHINDYYTRTTPTDADLILLDVLSSGAAGRVYTKLALAGLKTYLGITHGVFVYTEAELIAHKDDTDLVVVSGPITLLSNLTLTCPLYVEPGYPVSTNGYTLNENGPHLSMSAYQQYIAGSGEVVFGSDANGVLLPEWWGAVADGTADGSGTNSTSGIGCAITAAGGDKVVRFQGGYYIISPGELPKILCDLHGPQTFLVGDQNVGGAILNVDYSVGWKSHRITLRGIIGDPDDTWPGSGWLNDGIYGTNLSGAVIDIGLVLRCRYGVFLDGYANDNHQGSNTITIQQMLQCDIGAYLKSGVTPINLMCENNRFYGQYWYGFTTSAIKLEGGNNNWAQDNVFDIQAMGEGSYTSCNLIDFNLYSNYNKINLQAWDTFIPSGSSKHIVSLGQFNVFSVPSFDYSLCSITYGSDFIDIPVFQRLAGVTASRALGVAYISAYGTPTFIYMTATAGAGGATLRAYLGQTSTPSVLVSTHQLIANETRTITLLVPPNTYHKFAVGSGSATLAGWLEVF